MHYSQELLVCVATTIERTSDQAHCRCLQMGGGGVRQKWTNVEYGGEGSKNWKFVESYA